MFIKRLIEGGRVFYYVYEVYRPEGGTNSSSRIIASLGHEKHLGRAYIKALSEHLKSADRLERLEHAANVLGWEAAYRGDA